MGREVGTHARRSESPRFHQRAPEICSKAITSNRRRRFGRVYRAGEREILIRTRLLLRKTRNGYRETGGE